MSSTKLENLNFDWVGRLRRLVDIYGGGKQKDFAVWCGESPTRINTYLVGGTENPASDFICRLIERGISANWFLTGVGDMYIKDQRTGTVPENIQTLANELVGWSSMTDDLIRLVRAKKESLEVEEKLKASFRRKKK